MSLTVRDPPQRRRSLGPVSPKRLYRNLTVRLRCGDAALAGETTTSKHPCKAMRLPFKTLWEAVENEDTLAVQSLLLRERSSCGRGGEGGGGNSTWDRRERRKADFHRNRERELNMVSDQGLVPLDVAALTHNAPLLHVLTKAGARHNPVLCRPEEWAVKLDALVALATTQVEEKTEELASKAWMGTQAQADSQRQICLWSLRLQLYCRMRENLQATDLPRPPSNVSILVTSASSLLVTVREPESNSVGLVTRYRVDWSSSASFTSILGTAQVLETKSPTCSITGLKKGVAYFVKASAYNVKGWGPPQCSTPMSAAPSCWRECVGVKSQLRNQDGLKKLLDQTKEPHYGGYCLESCKSQCPSKRVSMSRGIKQLFHSATKFVRLLQRGVYLTTVFYHKENILLTAEDQLPLVEIQCCSTSFTQDFIWFAKLSYAWQQVPWLQQALSSAHSSSSSLLQNRQSILRAISQLQSSLGTEDLGQVHYEPLKDRQGNVLLVTVKAYPHLPHPPDPPLHWAPISHLEKNRSRTALLPEPTAMDTLIDQLKEKLSFHRHSVQWAQPGLYVGILKLCSSVDQIRVLVPQRLPNLLCHARVRHNAHVTRDEWAWLQSHVFTAANGSLQSPLSGANEKTTESSGLPEFVRSLRAAVALLLTKLNIPLYRAYQYGVYTRELLQFGDRLSMILLLPPSEDFSSSYWPLVGTKEPGLTMPLQIFELVHFWTYEPDLLSQYCQVWVRLELDTHLAQQNLREALEPSEVQEGRQRLSHITQLSQRLDAVWRDARWIMDCLQCVRSRQWVGAVPLGPVMGGHPAPPPDTQVEEGEESRTARLSWPHQIHRTVSESQASIPENIVSAEVSVPAEDLGERETSASLVLIEGVAKGGYPLDISTQPALDLASITQTELGRESTISPSGIEPAKAVQQDVGCHGVVAATPYIDDRSFSSSISEVIQPVEPRALADILPKLSLITEKEDTCVNEPMAQSMMDMFENFGLDIGENCNFFDMVNSELINGAESLSHSEIDMTSELGLAERCYEDRVLLDQDSTANATGTATTAVTSDLAKAENPNNGTFSTVRNQVEWVSSSHTPS